MLMFKKNTFLENQQKINLPVPALRDSPSQGSLKPWQKSQAPAAAEGQNRRQEWPMRQLTCVTSTSSTATFWLSQQIKNNKIKWRPGERSEFIIRFLLNTFYMFSIVLAMKGREAPKVDSAHSGNPGNAPVPLECIVWEQFSLVCAILAAEIWQPAIMWRFHQLQCAQCLAGHNGAAPWLSAADSNFRHVARGSLWVRCCPGGTQCLCLQGRLDGKLTSFSEGLVCFE